MTIRETLNNVFRRLISSRIRQEIQEKGFDEAANILAHYHAFHTQDKVTRFRCSQGPEYPTVDIYIVTDPEWRRKLEALTEEIFECPHKEN